MSERWEVAFNTNISLMVYVDAESEDEAADKAWEDAEGYLTTLVGDGLNVIVNGCSLDGIGADFAQPSNEVPAVSS